MRKMFKNISITIASLALIAPLALNFISNSDSANAKTRHTRTALVYHHRAKTHHRTHVYKHHYYKFAYNKANYRAYLKDVKQNKRIDHRIEHRLNYKHRTAMYKRGVRNAVDDVINHRLAHNHQYKSGYVHAIALDNYYGLSKRKLRDATHTFHFFVKNGTNGYYINLLKGEAEMGTLASK